MKERCVSGARGRGAAFDVVVVVVVGFKVGFDVEGGGGRVDILRWESRFCW